MMGVKRIFITGQVQGVGFRPFVFRLAKKLGLSGYVRNAGNCVEVVCGEGEDEIRKFLETLKNNLPPLASIKKISVEPMGNITLADQFHIADSSSTTISGSDIPPDVSTCHKCDMEILDRSNPRYLYPFTVCTDCGPRFSVIEGLPYDRKKTTMEDFTMCAMCREEYENPLDRRFHAEPIACPKCGPEYFVYKGREKITGNSPIKTAARILEEGKILAIKGIGGTHLACRCDNDDAVVKIRRHLGRPQKPFAVMVRDLESAREIVRVSRKVQLILESFRRPIVLLKKKIRPSGYVSENISPGLDNLGLVLPYSAFHRVLFHYYEGPALVMTSANLPGEPMAIADTEIIDLGAQDYSLIHNRRIKNRVDDSVVKIVGGSATMVRRSRGFVPTSLDIAIENDRNILSLGAQEDLVACMLMKNRAFLSQYVGNTIRPATIDYLEEAVQNLIELCQIDSIHTVAVDAHPGYSTTKLGERISRELDAKLVKVQHHKAHLLSLAAESGVGDIVCMTADGMGYGDDGTIWGGEIFSFSGSEIVREGGLESQPLPGGDLATRYPFRVLAGIMGKVYEGGELAGVLNGIKHGQDKTDIKILLKQIETGFNTPISSSTGRILDCISYILGVCSERTYEGEPAMKLESFALGGKPGLPIPLEFRNEKGRRIMDTTPIIDFIYQNRDKYPKKDLAASGQRALAQGLLGIAMDSAEKNGIKNLGISGGVAYNDAIVTYMKKEAKKEGYKFLTHRKVPPGDGGISLGQVYGAVVLGERDGL